MGHLVASAHRMPDGERLPIAAPTVAFRKWNLGYPPIAAAMASSAASALAPSGPPACAMSGLPPPPLPPSTSDALRTRSTAEKRVHQIGRHANHDTCLAVLTGRDQRDHAGPELFLAVIGEVLEILDLDAFDRTRHQLDAADIAHTRPGAATMRSQAPPPPIASFFRASDSSRSSFLRSSISEAIRAGMSSSVVRNSPAAVFASWMASLA